MINFTENILELAYNGCLSEKIYITLERYFNDGSPSGFYLNLPDKYHPSNENKLINIPYFYERFENHLQIGKLPKSLDTQDGRVPFFFHPYIIQKENWIKLLRSKDMSVLKAQPTASGRTMLVEDSEPWFVKLNFPFVLGRFTRELSMFKWISAIERSRELESFKQHFPATLSILNDFGGTYYQHPDNQYSFGTLFRGYKPIPELNNRYLLIPSFSLFSHPIKPRTQSILADFIQFLSLDLQLFINLFVRPLIEAFYFLSNHVGLIPEFNAQNVLFQFDLVKKHNRIVLRDHGDCFIDYLVREENGLHTSFCTYKNIHPDIHKDFYQRRSFAFDFKLSKYILLPLIQEYCTVTKTDINTGIDEIKKIVHHHFPNYKEYFRSDKWYSYPNRLGVGRNSYEENDKPLFR